MKKKFVLGTLFVLTALTGAIFINSASAEKKAADSLGSGTTLLVENFTYAPGSALTANGWTAHSGAGTNAIVTSEPGLTVSGYPSSGIGNSVALTTSGEDVNRAFAPQASGSVYAAFMVNVSEASTDAAGGYFFHLGPDPIGTTFRGRVFIKKDASNNIAFGISKAATVAADIAYTPFSYSLNTTYLLVVKYTVVDGSMNDTVSLFVSATTPATEPAPTVSATDVATQSDITPASAALRQGATATAPTVRVDGIRVGTSWESVTQAGTPAQTQHVVDFNGDGKTDFAVVRNVGGGPGGQVRWFINYNGTATTVASDWGISTDIFVPEDYDGDDKTDIAVWRDNNPNEGAFYILQSQSNTVRIEPFGVSGDDPTVVGDYDGDGKADVAVYREGALTGEQSTWFYRGSANNPGGNITFVPWGITSDFPAPGDYDGDGRNDFVVQRNDGGGRGRFWRKLSSGASDTVAFGAASDLILPGDYDGDGKTDIATARNVGGAIQWQYLSSQNSTINYATFGIAATDFPVQGDYDGDGRTDFAVWRPSATAGASTFWIFGSTSGAFGVPFGAQGDYPVANFNSH